MTNLKTDINTIEIPDEVPTSVLGKSTKPVNDEAVAYYKQVALNMRKARRQLNLTQQQIADAMDIPRSTYKSLESGEVGIYCFHMAKWSMVTGYDIQVITKGTQYDVAARLTRLELVELIEELSTEKYDSIVSLLKAFKG
ncbi:MAG: transcriptional regulator with XRE-family HTH domain [Alteromonadaceae bacterium]